MDPSRFARRPDGPNVVVLIVDTLRADYVGAYGGRARTPTIDALARAGLRFTRFHPEAMATVPARRSILTGRRVFPFRHWRRWPGLMNTPGWAPIADPDATFTSALRRAGWWTGYVTDNPFLGFSEFYAPLRRSFNRFVSVGGQVGRTQPLSSVSKGELRHWLVPELREPHIEQRVHRFLASGSHYWQDERRSWAARVYSAGAFLLDRAAAARRPFALVVDTFEPHEPWTPPRSYIDMYGDPDWRGPEPCMARYSRVRDYLKPDRRDRVIGRMRDLYAAEVTMTDRWMGMFLDQLHARGLADDTVIVLVSDHGYLLGEHGWTGKIASMLHPELMHVPFVLADPHGRRAGPQLRLAGPDARHRPDPARHGGREAARAHERHQPGAAAARRAPARAPHDGLRRLRQLALRPHRSLEARGRQHRPRPAALRQRARPRRAPQRGAQAPQAARRAGAAGAPRSWRPTPRVRLGACPAAPVAASSAPPRPPPRRPRWAIPPRWPGSASAPTCC